MSESIEQPRFVVGGPVPVDSAAYAERRFEADAYSELARGEWVLLLGPRQHGKTSALVRIQRDLLVDGFACAFIDMQRYGGGNEAYSEFLEWFARSIAHEVGSEVVPPADHAVSDLQQWLEGVLPERFANVVVILDEAGAVPEPFRHQFFAQLRALFNARARVEAQALPRRVAFVFAGTFRPESMIDSEANSPFNISKSFAVEHLSEERVVALAEVGLGERTGEFGRKAFGAVAGQPYLTQRLLSAVQRADEGGEDEAFDRALREIDEGVDRHVPDLMVAISRDGPLTDLVHALATSPFAYDGTNATHQFAVVTGIARVTDGELSIANAVYLAAVQRAGIERAEAGTDWTEPETCDVLLVTANEIETIAVREVLSPGESFYRGNNTYRDLGLFGGARVVLVRSPQMGAGGPGGAALTIQDAVDDLQPSAVILVGVAFGVDNEDQGLSDVLCSTEIADYGLTKIVTPEGEGSEIQDRGSRTASSILLMGRFQNAALEFEDPVTFGQLLSGDVLVDNVDYRDGLKERFPDAVGGEMEARAAVAVGLRNSVEWIVVKAICDWADGTKQTNKESRQQAAADAAARFVRLTLELGGFAS